MANDSQIFSDVDCGVRNVLRLHQILVDEPFAAPAEPARVVAAEERDDYIMAPASGIFEPFYEMGQSIAAGQPIGQIHSIELAHQQPWPVVARTNGMLISRRAFPLTRQGDCVATLVRPFEL